MNANTDAPIESIDWNIVRSFLMVCETSQLTVAAIKLGLSQPTLGRHIRELERLAGESLFDRFPGKWTLTQKGQQLRAALDPMGPIALEFERALRTQAQRDVLGTVRITASESFATFLLPKILAQLKAGEPKLSFQVIVDPDELNLIRRDADIALRCFRPTQNSVIAAHLKDVEFGIFVGRSFVDRFGMPSSLDHLKGHLISPESTGPIVDFASSLGISLSDRDFSYKSNSELNQLAAIEAGLGAGALWVDLFDGREDLIRVFPGQVTKRVPLWLCSHEDLQRSNRLKVTFNFLANGIREALA